MKRKIALAWCSFALTSAVAQQPTFNLSDTERRIAALEGARPTPAPSTLHATWGPGVQLATEDKSIRLRVGARMQQDWSFVLDADRALLDHVGAFDDTVDFRRIQLEMDGALYDRTLFSYHVDFAGGKVGVRNLYLGLKDIPYWGVVRVGSQQEPFGLEELTANNYITFLERALDLFYPSYNVGVLAQRGFANQRINLSYGAFREADDTGRLSSDDGYSLTARITGLPMASKDGRRLIHLGIAASQRTTPNGRVDYRGRPVNRWAPPFVAATNIVADEASLAGLEAAAVWGSLSFQSEWNMAAPDTEGNDPEFSAYYVQISYFLTGEHRSYNKAGGCFGAIAPKRPFGKGGWGAWEVACRLSNADLTDGEIAGGEMQNVTAGLNWYANSVARVMLNFVRTDLDGVGESDAVLARFQIAF
jgi:phosphate-selective porin OprO/OprP